VIDRHRIKEGRAAGGGVKKRGSRGKLNTVRGNEKREKKKGVTWFKEPKEVEGLFGFEKGRLLFRKERDHGKLDAGERR